MSDLRVFSDRYEVHDDGTNDPPWSLFIPGEFGMIYLHSSNGSLAVLVQSPRALHNLVALGLQVLERGDLANILVFDSRLLDHVADAIRAQRRSCVSIQGRGEKEIGRTE